MDFHSVRSFIEVASDEILTNPDNGVIGLSVGRKHGGPITLGGREYCITVFVRHKFSPQYLLAMNIRDAYELCNEAAQRILKISLAPQDVDVVEAGDDFRLQATYIGSDHAHPASVNTQKWFSQLRPGIGVSNAVGYPKKLDVGTIGFFAKTGDGTVYLVSCNHVIARQKTSDPYLPDQAVIGESIIQPGTIDLAGSGISRLTFAQLTRELQVATLAAFVEVDVYVPKVYLPTNAPLPANKVDAALARISGDRSNTSHLSRLPYGGRFLGEHEYRPNGLTDIIEGTSAVFKCGRTTGYTEGIVTTVEGSYHTDFGGKKAKFVEQITVQPAVDNTGRFSDAGDSGSAVVTEDHKIVGMLSAGGPNITW